jgi:DNA end-binding protein Ku
MLTSVIEERSKPWNPDFASDPVQEQLQKIIASKKKGRKPPKPKAPEETPSNVVNIMDALRKSVEADLKGRKAG